MQFARHKKWPTHFLQPHSPINFQTPVSLIYLANGEKTRVVHDSKLIPPLFIFAKFLIEEGRKRTVIKN